MLLASDFTGTAAILYIIANIVVLTALTVLMGIAVKGGHIVGVRGRKPI